MNYDKINQYETNNSTFITLNLDAQYCCYKIKIPI